MTSLGAVQAWYDEEGWGVIDSETTPGGCWASFASVLVEGYKSLPPGQQVRFNFEAGEQDGYRSTLTIDFVDDEDERSRP